jgi:hypothetical protein
VSRHPCRAASRQVWGHFPPEVLNAISELAKERNVTHQLIPAEALNDLFEKMAFQDWRVKTPRRVAGQLFAMLQPAKMTPVKRNVSLSHSPVGLDRGAVQSLPIPLGVAPHEAVDKRS